MSTLWSPGLSLPVTSDRTASISSNHPLVNTECVKHLRALDHISDNIQFPIEKFENLLEKRERGVLMPLSRRHRGRWELKSCHSLLALHHHASKHSHPMTLSDLYVGRRSCTSHPFVLLCFHHFDPGQLALHHTVRSSHKSDNSNPRTRFCCVRFNNIDLQ